MHCFFDVSSLPWHANWSSPAASKVVSVNISTLVKKFLFSESPVCVGKIKVQRTIKKKQTSHATYMTQSFHHDLPKREIYDFLSFFRFISYGVAAQSMFLSPRRSITASF